jgi:hypothetical protein
MSWELLENPSVLFAAFGALGMQLLSLMEIKNIPKAERPDFKDFFYWLPFLLAPLVGGGLALVYIYPADVLKPLVALNVGVSAPLILRSMANINPLDKGDINPGPGA